ncbi:MAG TPA: hypothetical protein VFC21_09525 [Bryobacteraceae bacterium]|nr:hypothetical protein [Bryobacteraceae bacterium]
MKRVISNLIYDIIERGRIEGAGNPVEYVEIHELFQFGDQFGGVVGSSRPGGRQGAEECNAFTTHGVR